MARASHSLKSFVALVLALLLQLTLVTSAGAVNRPLVVDLSDDSVSINVGFNGAELLMFGALELPKPDAPFDLFVNVVGPTTDIRVRKKARTFGLWINRDSAVYEGIPGFYKSFTSRPLSEMMSTAQFELLRDKGFGLIGVQSNGPDFDRALIRQMAAQDLFETRSDAISFLSNQLFRADIRLPSNVPTGTYNVQVRLTQDGVQLHSSSTPLQVKKVGIGAGIYDFAQHYGFLYGVLAVLLAIAMGYASYMVFNRR